MRRILSISFLLMLLISACSLINTNDIPTQPALSAMEQTKAYNIVETIIAREQFTKTPSIDNDENNPTTTTNLIPGQNEAIASAINSETIVFKGPGNAYRMACYIDQGTQMTIIGRNIDASWVRVVFDPVQTCYTMDSYSTKQIISFPPDSQYWVMCSSLNISGSLNDVAIVSAPTLEPQPGIFTPTPGNSDPNAPDPDEPEPGEPEPEEPAPTIPSYP